MKKNRILVNELISLNGVNSYVINVFLILIGTLMAREARILQMEQL